MVALKQFSRTYAPTRFGESSAVVWPQIPSMLPGRLNAEQAAEILGFSPNDIAALVVARLLVPLGNPTQQAVKHFARLRIEECVKSEKWLHEATHVIYEYHKSKNSRKSSARESAIA